MVLQAFSGCTMPIYAYRCEECGFSQDILQKLSDAPVVECPSCGKSGFKKQLTAAGIGSQGSKPDSFAGGCGACPMAGGFGGPCG